MCQLTFINMQDIKLARQLLTIQLTMNSLVDNKDGFGFFSKSSGLMKSRNDFSMTIDIGSSINNIKTSPIISHVRKATFTNGNKTVCEENSHPFSTEKLILAHNGVLEAKNIETMKLKEYSGLIDSNIFALELTKNFSGIEFIDAIKKTVDQFYGKFAFMIYNRLTDEFFIVRGETAQLYRYDFYTSDNKHLGYYINTDKQAMLEGVLLLINLNPTTNIEYKSEFMTELEKNVIYKVKSKFELEKVGEAKETTRPVAQQATSGYPLGTYWNNNNNNRVNQNNAPTITESNKKLSNDLLYLGLDIYDLDFLCVQILGTALLGLIDEDAELVNNIIRILKKRFFTKKKRAEFIRIKDLAFIHNNLTACNELKLMYPYLMNDIGQLRAVRIRLENIEKEKNEQKNNNVNHTNVH